MFLFLSLVSHWKERAGGLVEASWGKAGAFLLPCHQFCLPLMPALVLPILPPVLLHVLYLLLHVLLLRRALSSRPTMPPIMGFGVDGPPICSRQEDLLLADLFLSVSRKKVLSSENRNR